MKKIIASILLSTFIVTLVGCSAQNSSSAVSLPTQVIESASTNSTSVSSENSKSNLEVDNPLTPEDIKTYFDSCPTDETMEKTMILYTRGVPYATNSQKDDYGNSLDNLLYSISFIEDDSNKIYHFAINAGIAATDWGINYSGYDSKLVYEGNGIYSTSLIWYPPMDTENTKESDNFTITFLVEKIPNTEPQNGLYFTLLSYEGNNEDYFMDNFENILNVRLEFVNWEKYGELYIKNH